MGKTLPHLTDELRAWIAKQKIFFVSTAPLAAEGHVNCSPKGLDSLRILDDLTVAYQDLTGSGIETVAHLRENGRMLIMLCAFSGPPRIVRLHGKGEAVTPDDERFAQLAAHFPKRRGVRSIIVLHISRIANSCGYSVPLMDFKADRDVMDKWIDRKTDGELEEYRLDKNQISLDGLKGL
jgi:hypothetical protein